MELIASEVALLPGKVTSRELQTTNTFSLRIWEDTIKSTIPVFGESASKMD